MRDSSAVAEFHRAVACGDVGRVRAMAGRDSGLVCATDAKCFGTTPLIVAAGADNIEMVDLLLGLGADIHQRSDWWAGSFGVLDSGTDAMAEHLLARGAALTPHAAARLGKVSELRAMVESDASVAHARGGDGQTPLHFARTIEVAELLLGHGAVIDALDIDHASTPAQWLCGTRPEVASYLVSKGAASDPFITCRIGDVKMLERCLASEADGLQVRVTRERFPAPAPAAGHIYLYTIGERCSLMHAAAESERTDVIRWLAARGADVNARGGYDDATPLHASAWGDRVASIGALVDVGADINAVSGSMHRNQPIGWAIVGGSAGAFRVLRERGAKIHPWHLEDAARGAKGEFKLYNAKRPLAAWGEIARELGV